MREEAGPGGVGAGRREDSPQLRVFLSNNNVIRIIHPRIPVTEESLSVNTGRRRGREGRGRGRGHSQRALPLGQCIIIIVIVN